MSNDFHSISSVETVSEESFVKLQNIFQTCLAVS